MKVNYVNLGLMVMYRQIRLNNQNSKITKTPESLILRRLETPKNLKRAKEAFTF